MHDILHNNPQFNLIATPCSSGIVQLKRTQKSEVIDASRKRHYNSPSSSDSSEKKYHTTKTKNYYQILLEIQKDKEKEKWHTKNYYQILLEIQKDKKKWHTERLQQKERMFIWFKEFIENQYKD
ncbi:hypothetical protein QE152_g15262 [Popillia japonica]|uniref:Uncharacterized protein n=1 Tax=Popillia japonica TaxID=7064 RepID=A0AAW1LAA2_POPJA